MSVSFQSTILSASTSSLIPIAYFAPKSAPAPSPFVWVNPPPAAPFITTNVQSPASLQQAWQGASRPPAPIVAKATAGDPATPWQPAAVDPNAPLAPPDGVPVAPAGGFAGPLPGIEQVVGNSVITGEVSDSVSLNPIAGAFVDVMGTGRTAETDANGRFSIGGLPVGTFTLEATKLGYFNESAVITTLEGQPAQARFGLRLKPADDSVDETMLEEETIVGEYQQDSQGDFNLEIATSSPNISAGLNKDDFSRTGASDAGAAVSKIAGANIVGGRYAVVRGLGDRYSNTLFNGALIPSADPSKKAVQLDLFPSDLLESVAITKLFLPELPAEFAGGTVQIQTLRLPEEPIVEVSMGTKWFSERPDGGFMGDPTTNTNFDGIEFPELPAGFDQPNGFTGSVADMIALHSSAPMRPSKVDDDQALSYSVILGNTYKLNDGVRIGGVFALTRDTQNSYEDATLGRGFNFDDPRTSVPDDPYIRNTRRSEVFSRELNFGLMSGLSLELIDRHDIGFTYFFNESFDDSYVRTTNSRTVGFAPIFTANPYGEIDPNTGLIARAYAQPIGAADFFEPLKRSLEVSQLNGEHVIYGEKDRGGTFSWMVSDATAIEERPHSRTYSWTPLDFADEETIPPVTFEPGQFRPDFPLFEGAGDPVLANGFPEVGIFRESLKTTDEGENRRFDVTLPYYLEDDTDDRVGIRFGYNTSERKREVRGRSFQYNFNQINDELLIENSQGVYQGTFGNIFHQNFNSSYFPNDPNRPIFGGTGIIIGDFSAGSTTIRNIDAGTEIDATYIGADCSLRGWTLSGGARLESESRSYQILPILNAPIVANPEPVVFDEDTILPGVVLTKKMGDEDQILITTGWSRTVARPTFYEFAPAFVVDQATGDVTRGNPDLTNSSITNFDLRFDWKVDETANWGIGLFTKTIEAPIVDAFDPVINAQSWVNGDKGTINGIELEANKLFAERYRIGGNYTYINSELQYTLQNVEQTTGFTGQPEHILNLFAGYENEENGLSINFVYNFTGEFMDAAPALANVPAIMEESYKSVDLILSKSFDLWDCDGKVTVGIRNLLDSTRRQSFDGTDSVFREYNPGRSVSLSCEVNF